MDSPSLFITCPELKTEWDADRNQELNPLSLTRSSKQKAWWRCPLGHSWNAEIKSRAVSGTGCPYCSNRYAWIGFNDLPTKCPGIEVEWDSVKNDKSIFDVTDGSTYKAWWLCSKGHSYQMSIRFKCRRGQQCPYCINKKILVGYNDLFTLRPDLESSWSSKNTLDPLTVGIGSGKVAHWCCPEGHEWATKIIHRSKHGCARCSTKYAWGLTSEERSLSSRYPAIAAYWDTHRNKENPSVISPHTKGTFWWICPIHSRSYKYSMPLRVQKTEEFCACDRVETSDGWLGSLQNLIPTSEDSWDYSKNDVTTSPNNVLRNSNIDYWFKCEEGHSVKVSPSLLGTRGEVPCGYCKGIKVVAGINDLESMYPLVADLWDVKRNDISCREVFYKSYKKFWFVCEDGHEYSQYLYREITGEYGCPYCSGRLVTVGVNDLRTTHPDLAKELENPSIALEFKSNSSERVKWICNEGHRWETMIRHRAHNLSGCPNCWNRGTSRIEEYLRDSILCDQRFYGTVDTGTTLPIPWRTNLIMSVDILTTINDKPLVVEYDGWYWHKDREAIDSAKTEALLESGYCVVRLREGVLDPIELHHPNLLQLPIEYSVDGTGIPKAITSVVDWAVGLN